jgi:hypothetical protein
LKQGFDKLSPNGLKGVRFSLVFPFALSLSKGEYFKLTHYAPQRHKGHGEILVWHRCSADSDRHREWD